MNTYQSTKLIELGSCAFRQWRASHSHCKFLHGYQLKAKLWFGASSLDEKNWCVDFGGLKELKGKLQYIFDHTTTVAADDPELETFKDLDRKGLIQLRIFDNGVGIERVAETVFEIANDYIKSATNDRCWVDRVEVFEHEENSATFTHNCTQKQCLENDCKNKEESITEQNTPVITQNVTSESNTQTQPSTRAAHVGPNVSEGKGNWFSGTSWG